MLSPAFRASEYIRDTESPLIRGRVEAINGLIVPVVLKRTRWEPIAGNLHAVPRQGRDVLAVADWTPPDHGFAAAEEQIAAAIQDHFDEEPARQIWPNRLLHAPQNLEAPVWVIAGRQLALDPKGDRIDAVALAARTTKQMLGAVREKTRALLAALPSYDNDPAWVLTIRGARTFAKELETDPLTDRIVPLWSAYNDVASGFAARKGQVPELDAWVATAAPLVHRFATLKGIETSPSTLPVTPQLAEAVAALLRLAEDRALITPTDADGLLDKLALPDDAARAYAAGGARNLLIEMGHLGAAFLLGRWDAATADDRVLLGRIAAFLKDLGDGGVDVLPDDLRHAFGELRSSAGRSELVVTGRQRTPRGSRPGDIERDGPNYPQMVLIPGGSYIRGVPEDEEEREAGEDEDARPVHLVTIHLPFWLGRYLVTRGQFAAFVAETKRKMPNKAWTYEPDETGEWARAERTGRNWRYPGYEQTDEHPVVCVNHSDATAFATWLSRKTGKHYRLPSEAEWEYAARAGTVTARFWGDGREGARRYGNIADRSLMQRTNAAFDYFRFIEGDDGYAFTSPVGSFAPNPFGLCDTLGNVWEWCADVWRANYADAPSDESAWTTDGDGRRRPSRGGSWFDHPTFVRAGVRGDGVGKTRDSWSGFRLARTL